MLTKHRRRAIKSADIIDFTQQCRTLLDAGIAILRAIEIIAQCQTRPAMRTLLYQVLQQLRAGHSLSHTLANHPDVFDPFYCRLIHAGELASCLPTVLQQLQRYQQKRLTLSRQIKQALFYPLLVLGVAAAVTLGLLLFIVPQFQQLFASFHAQLPLLTRWVIGLSTTLQHYGWQGGALLLTLAIGLKGLYQRYAPVTLYIDQLLLRLPAIGTTLTLALIARFTRTLSTLLSAGVPIPQALHTSRDMMPNRYFQHTTRGVAALISSGQPLNVALQTSPLFSYRVMQMIAIGEQSNRLESMLANIADDTSAQVDHRVARLNDLLEPMIMLLLGGIVGSLIAAMYLPIFQLGAVI